MVSEVLTAILMAGLPVAAFTFLILQWSIASGRMMPFDEDENLAAQYKERVQEHKKAQKENTADTDEDAPLFSKKWGGDMFHNKVMSFGGGFYGTMALLTYIVVETIEVWNFLGKIFGSGSWFENLGFGLILDFIVNSIMNFVAAMVWFITLQDFLPIEKGFVWLVVAYGGYLAGLKITMQKGSDLWEKLGSAVASVKSWVAREFFGNSGLQPSAHEDNSPKPTKKP